MKVFKELLKKLSPIVAFIAVVGGIVMRFLAVRKQNSALRKADRTIEATKKSSAKAEEKVMDAEEEYIAVEIKSPDAQKALETSHEERKESLSDLLSEK